MHFLLQSKGEAPFSIRKIPMWDGVVCAVLRNNLLHREKRHERASFAYQKFRQTAQSGRSVYYPWSPTRMFPPFSSLEQNTAAVAKLKILKLETLLDSKLFKFRRSPVAAAERPGEGWPLAGRGATVGRRLFAESPATTSRTPLPGLHLIFPRARKRGGLPLSVQSRGAVLQSRAVFNAAGCAGSRTSIWNTNRGHLLNIHWQTGAVVFTFFRRALLPSWSLSSRDFSARSA